MKPEITDCLCKSDPGSINPYADFSNSSRPISMRRISLVPAPIS
jgi:hypothetical protein